MFCNPDDPHWENLRSDAADRVKSVASGIIETLWQAEQGIENRVSIAKKNLSFYKNYSLYRFTRPGYRPLSWRYFLASDLDAASAGNLEGIYAVNQKAPISLSEKNIEDYALFLLPKIYATDIYTWTVIGDPQLHWPREAEQNQIDQFDQLAHKPRLVKTENDGSYSLNATMLNQKTKTLYSLFVVIDINGIYREAPDSRKILLSNVLAYRMILR